MTLNSNKSEYLRIIEKIQCDIIAGIYKPGTKLPSIRKLALDFSVNPNTMHRALLELEKDYLIYSIKTNGKYVTSDISVIDELKNVLVIKNIDDFLNKMKSLGLYDEEIISLVSKKVI